MQYEGSVYRPPSEAYSLILQVTIGCSHNKCSFCSMFKDKKFRVRSMEEIKADLADARGYYRAVERIFLADGDALCLSMQKLLDILAEIKKLFPECKRVGIYGSARDVLRKSLAELKELKQAGLGIVYLGAESGSQEILDRINKNATRQELIDAVKLIEESGIRSSVTFISGMGGKSLWREHALETASMINEMQPYYASVLTLMIDPAAPIYDEIQSGAFQLLSPVEVMDEMELLMKNIDVTKPCVFRSNHASNYLSLKGDLPQDKERMLAQIKQARQNSSLLKDEHFRAL